MADFIDRKALIKKLKKDPLFPLVEQYGITGVIESFPASDVRPVVLCRDCKWYQIDELKKDGTEDKRYKPSVCVLAEQRREPNHFCADGEKREES